MESLSIGTANMRGSRGGTEAPDPPEKIIKI